MFNFVKGFVADESGAVTIDWVVLTAGVVGLAISTYAAIELSTHNLINAAAVAVDTENDFQG